MVVVRRLESCSNGSLANAGPENCADCAVILEPKHFDAIVSLRSLEELNLEHCSLNAQQ